MRHLDSQDRSEQVTMQDVLILIEKYRIYNSFKRFGNRMFSRSFIYSFMWIRVFFFKIRYERRYDIAHLMLNVEQFQFYPDLNRVDASEAVYVQLSTFVIMFFKHLCNDK